MIMIHPNITLFSVPEVLPALDGTLDHSVNFVPSWQCALVVSIITQSNELLPFVYVQSFMVFLDHAF